MLYLIIGLVIVVIIVIFLWSRSKKSKEGMQNKQMRQPTEQEMMEMQKKLQEILSYDLEDEPEIMKQLPHMSIQDMSKYADKIAVKNIGDDKFLDAIAPPDLIQKLEKAPLDDERARHMLLNPSLFGNLALLVVNSKEPYTSRANQAIEFLKSKL